MKRSIFLCLALTAAFFTVSIGDASFAAGKSKKSASSSSDKASSSSKDKAAVVNGTVITQAAYDQEVSRFQQQMQRMGQNVNPEQMGELKKKVLDSMINRELLLQECKRLGIKANDDEIDQQVAAIKSKVPNEADFTNMLTTLNVTEADFRNEIARDLTVKKFIMQEIAPKASVTPEESKAFYDAHPDLFKMPERVHASHILVKVEPNATQDDKDKALKKMKDIQKRIKKGEDFATVAKEVSDCPSKVNGGDLGVFPRGKMDPKFEDAAFALKPGEVSDIVETQFGYHLIKLTEKKEAGVEAYDNVKDVLEKRMRQDKIGQIVSQYIDGLKAKAKIETFAKD
jgi:peptidyl-prolyl cis-trans isomerase C